MDSWQQEWLKMLDAMAIEMDRFFQDIAKDVADAADTFVELSEEIADHIQQAIAPELDTLDEQMEEWVEPILLAIGAIEGAFSEAAEPLTQSVDPLLNHHPVCAGCRHYHGQTYNGVMLVCAMHPYGVDEGIATCADKESVSWIVPRNLLDPSDF